MEEGIGKAALDIPRRLYVDGRWQGQHGIGRYATEILRRLPHHTSLQSQRVRPASPLDPPWLGDQLRRRRASAFFSPGFNVGMSRLPQVPVVHDLIHIRYPQESSNAKRAYYELLLKPVIRRTGLVITVSQFSKSDIVEWAKLDPDQVVVAPGALSRDFELARTPSARSQSQETAPFVLFVGNARPHKNLELVLESMKYLGDLKLVCVGVHSEQIGNKGVETRAGLSDVQLAQLYADAACLAFPSRYEGFGLPALEALSQGTPVAYLSDAVGETVGADLGIQARPSATAREFAACVREAITLGEESRFRAQAIARSHLVSWDRSAEVIASSLARIAE